MSDDDVMLAIARAVRGINEQPTMDETMREIVRATLASVAGIDHVGISTIDRRGVPSTQAATSDLVWKLDDLQYGLDEGPCVDTLRGAEVVEAPHIRQDQRWPNYVGPAVSLGLRSQLAVRLFTESDGTVGGLNLYSTSSDVLDPEAVHVADALATYAALAMNTTREASNLREGLRSREDIGMAVGVLMVKYDIDAAAAFGFLTRTSSYSNTKVRVIARQIVELENTERAERAAVRPSGSGTAPAPSDRD